MVRIVPVKSFDMQRQTRIDRKGLEPFTDQLGVECADFGHRKLGAEHQKRPARDIDSDPCQCLVHRQMHTGIPLNAFFIAKRLQQGLSHRNADVLDAVVVVDMGVTVTTDRQINQRMAGEQLQHMIEKADTGLDIGLARAVDSQ